MECSRDYGKLNPLLFLRQLDWRTQRPRYVPSVGNERNTTTPLLPVWRGSVHNEGVVRILFGHKKAPIPCFHQIQFFRTLLLISILTTFFYHDHSASP
jgi:hypothetical protein